MSVDQVFAAQMWTWVDPMIKRDSHGRILIVNAAFLHLYGGTVETWTGNVIQGWPAPKATGEHSRFESRIPQESGQEIVYDWMECTLADGTALAMARDVTTYAQAASQPTISNSEMSAPTTNEQSAMFTQSEPPLDALTTSAPIGHATQMATQLSNNNPVSDHNIAPNQATTEAALQQSAPLTTPSTPIDDTNTSTPVQAPLAPAPQYNPDFAVPPEAENLTNPQHMPVQQTMVDPVQHQTISQTPQTTQAPTATTETVPANPAITAPQETAAQNVAPAPIAAPVGTQPTNTQPAQQYVETPVNMAVNPPTDTTNTPEPSRDFERRALPIENQESILGNNWRDAVIAKAVGMDETDIEKANGDEANSPTETVEGNKPKVLLAEDNAINALLTRTLLEAEGCECDVVEDGALAIEALKNTDYDMIFMDMRMPNMDGLEATRKIRAMGYDARKLPIVALTANAFDDDRNACFDSGMNDFMTKPVSADELSSMVKTHTAPEAEKNRQLEPFLFHRQACRIQAQFTYAQNLA